MAYQERKSALPGTPGIGGNKNIIKPAPQMIPVTASKPNSDTAMMSLVSLEKEKKTDNETPVFKENITCRSIP